MKPVPTYSLYGVNSSEPLSDQLHFESIASRSRLHGWEIRPHRHDTFLQILHIHAGGGEALLEERREPLRGGSLVTMPPRHIHGFVFTPDTDGMVVTMTESHLRTLLAGVPDALPLFDHPRHDRVRRGHALADALTMFRGEMEAVSAWRGASLSALLTLVLIGIARLANASAPAAARSNSRPARHFQHFQQLLEAEYREQKEIGYYAGAIGITPTQLNRVCRQTSGQSALQMIHARVLAEAQRDLLFSDLEIKHIALSLGFSDAAYFSRFFARLVGQAPTEFRQSGRARLPAFAVQPARESG
ncbi:helix-turn-helix domain-containing protein [Cupriavidus sp. UYPR2.512]|uniref:helix-turn-helix domain-containing protein n=1 Tax=Cupriavidus sp. UYPR2.512 TaxID=1080187 RepID=UPI0003A7204E|nr:helix-turn-helix domain-containing protein [Cupriavidus sp. UYPR2.512]UIF91775.1 helix-turn-helix domain-containing protein [Cupriavidus necator]